MNILKKGDVIYLSGIINENSDFSTLVTQAAPLKIDFKGVQRINSIGVRSWMRFLTQWNDKPLEYHSCSVVIVDQLSIIGTLRGIRSKVASVVSAYLPTECTGCGREGEALVTKEQFIKDPTLKSQLLPCESCGGHVNYLLSDFANLFVP